MTFLGLEVDDRRRLGVIGVLVTELAFADARGVLRLVLRKRGLVLDIRLRRLGRYRAVAVLRQAQQASRPDARGLVGSREAVGRRVGEARELARELARVLDDLLALSPDPVGLGVEVLEPLLGGSGDPRRLAARLLEAILRLAARLRRDRLGGVVRPL
jgi:hypothetical protein